jgi:hypothetical protein
VNVNRQVEGLVSKTCDGTADDLDYEQLRDLLKDSPEARLTYLSYVDMDGELEVIAGELRDQLATSANARRPRGPAWIALAAIAACLIAVFLWRDREPNSVDAALPAPTTFQLIAEHASVWGGGQAPLLNEPLDEPLRLLSGMAEIQTSRDVRIIVRGPAFLAPAEGNGIILRHGRLRCEVPESARGFTVQTPRADVVDLGTHFGVNVAPNGGEELHVFDGKVRLSAKLSQWTRLLTSGHACRLETDGSFREIELRPQDYPQAAKPAEAYDRVLQNAYSLGRQDAVRVCYTFDDLSRMEGGVESSRVTNLAVTSTSMDGTVLGADPVRGRFTGSRALRFDSRADAVRFTFDANFTQATFLTWIKLDELPQDDFTSLLMTDRWNEEGQIHWQMRSRKGIVQLEFSVYGHSPVDFYSDPLSRDLLVGRWAHLATVFDGESRTIRHYLDGELIGGSDNGPTQAHVGDGQLGAWAAFDTAPTIRPLAGVMDEFLLIERVLSDQEIRDLYVAGLPEPDQPQ